MKTRKWKTVLWWLAICFSFFAVDGCQSGSSGIEITHTFSGVTPSATNSTFEIVGTEFPTTETVTPLATVIEDTPDFENLDPTIESTDNSSPPNPMTCLFPDIGLGGQIMDWLWSPNSSHIALVIQPRNGIPSTSIVITIPISENSVVEYPYPLETFIESYGWGEYIDFAWFPDSQELLLVQKFDQGTSFLLGNLDNIDKNPGTLLSEITLPFIVSPAVSPDGHYLAFYGGNNVLKPYLFDFYTNELVKLSEIYYPVTRPVWSSDNQQIAFTVAQPIPGEDYDKENIFRINLNNQEIVQVTDDPECAMNPAWSPNGEKILFEANTTGNRDLFLANSDGQDLENLTLSEAYETQGDWSSQGDRIVFVSHFVEQHISLLGDGSQDIFVMNLADHTLQQLTYTPNQWELLPKWSPSGQYIGFVVTNPDDFTESFVIIDLLDGNQFTLFTID